MTVQEIIFIFSFSLFAIGVAGVVATQNNFLFALMSIEIMLLSSIFLFTACSIFFIDSSMQAFVLLILTVAAAESAVGLALLIHFFKSKGSISYSFANLIKG